MLLILTTNAMAIETLNYTIIEKDKKIELRQYDNYIAASVTFDSKEEFDKKAFRTLADYIFGNNISMTSPVLTKGEKISMTSPVLSDDNGNSWTMTFSMPSKYTLSTLPKPNNKLVKIHEVPSSTLAVIRFSGFMSDYNYNKNANILKGWLTDKNILFAPNYIRAGYNPPWTPPFLRRNEVLISVEL